MSGQKRVAGRYIEGCRECGRVGEEKVPCIACAVKQEDLAAAIFSRIKSEEGLR